MRTTILEHPKLAVSFFPDIDESLYAITAGVNCAIYKLDKSCYLEADGQLPAVLASHAAFSRLREEAD
jgi:hypothetical protein